MGKGRRCIYLIGGSEEGFGWELKIDVYSTSSSFSGYFNTASRQRKYRHNLRALDRKWAEKTFSRQWFKKYEIHHEWERGETVYFLTHEEHKRRKNDTENKKKWF